MQPRSNPDFMQGDFEIFSRVWCSIESLCLTSGLRKNYAREVGIRSVPQYNKSPNFLFWGLFRGGRTRKIGHYAKIRYGRGKDINPQRPHSMPYTKLVDLQDRLSKLCVVKERLVKLLEKELSVMRILHVLQFLLPH